MKTTFQTPLALVSSLLLTVVACSHIADLSPATSNDPVNIITGTVDVPVRADVKLPVPLGIPDLGVLRIAGSISPTIEYIALGGKLTAGYRDGGLYRAGQLTAFPNLIAHQMGLFQFRSPLFEQEQGNGSGYLVPDRSAKYMAWKQVVNNRAILSEQPLKLTKYSGTVLNNLGMPEGMSGVKAFNDNMHLLYPKQREYMAFFERIFSAQEEGKKTIMDVISERTPDFCTMEGSFDYIIGQAQYPRNASLEHMFMEVIPGQYVASLQKRGIKVVLFTVPQVLDLPYFHLYPIEDLLQQGKKVYVREHNNHPTPELANAQTLLLPTNAVRAVFLGQSTKGATYDGSFADEEAISGSEVNAFRLGIPAYNRYFIWEVAQKHNLPVVDLEGLYRKIQANQYTTEDGLRIDGTFPGGNFFSADGVSPSAVGQAVIANETITAINGHYGTRIPLIRVGDLINALK